MPATKKLTIVAFLAVTVSVAGCNSKKASSADSGVPAATAAAAPAASAANSGASAPAAAATGSSAVLPSGAIGAAPGKQASDITVRVVNLYAPKADSGSVAPGPALDIYDVHLNGQAATPVAKSVAYGSASPYFTAHALTNSAAVDLSALPAGEDPTTKQADAKEVNVAIDDGSHAQITELLWADNGGLSEGGALGRLTSNTQIEKGDDGNGGKGPVAPAAPSGQGEILVENPVVSQGLGLYLLIDSSCTPPINGDPLAKGLPEIFAAATGSIISKYAIFATTPGSHQVSVVNYTGGGAPTCDQLTAKQGTTTVNVNAGQQIEAYVYGTSATDLHLAFAPLQP